MVGAFLRLAHSLVGASKTTSTCLVPSVSRMMRARNAESTSWITPTSVATPRSGPLAAAAPAPGQGLLPEWAILGMNPHRAGRLAWSCADSNAPDIDPREPRLILPPPRRTGGGGA